MELKLTAEEQELLANILERCHRELSKEISHTDHHDFKETLRKNQKLLESILGHLQVESVQEIHV
jgi:mevalonate kinase